MLRQQQQQQRRGKEKETKTISWAMFRQMIQPFHLVVCFFDYLGVFNVEFLSTMDLNNFMATFLRGTKLNCSNNLA